jgi:biotin carboxylase
MKHILVLGASRANLIALEEMAKYARVTAADRNPYTQESQGCVEFVTLDYGKISELVKFIGSNKFDGIYPMSDHAIIPASVAVEEFNFFGYSPKIAENFLQKSNMRKLWAQNGLSQPRFKIVHNLEEALVAADEILFPLIIKPSASGGGGRGVYKISSKDELVASYSKTVESNRYSNEVLVEEFIDGIESSLELVVLNGESRTLCISTKVKEQDYSQVATEIAYPTSYSEKILKEIDSLCTNAFFALGEKSGVAHFEVIVTKDGIPFLVEVGGRVGGGHTFHPIASHVAGVSYPKLVADLYTRSFEAVKETLKKLDSNKQCGAVYSFPITKKEGIIKNIALESISTDSVIELWKKAGDQVRGLNDSMDRLGCIVTLKESREEALSENRKIMSSILLTVEKKFIIK